MEKTFLKSKAFNIVWSTLVAALGVLVIVFAILRWANVNDINPNLAIRVVFGVGCLLIGVILAILGLVNTSKSLEVTGIIAGSSLTAFGIFMFFEEAGAVMDTVLGLVTPIILVTFASYLLIKAIVSLCEKLDKRVCIAYIIVSAIIITLGVLLIVYRAKLINLIWIIVGVLMLLSGIANIIVSFKKEKNETAVTTDKAE